MSNNQNLSNSPIFPTLKLASAAVVAVAVIHNTAIAATPEVSEESETTLLEQQVVTGERDDAATPGGNPYADADAPYKIDRSANTKFTEPLLNVSKTITVIGKEQLKDSSTTALKELMVREPGITLGTGEGGNAYGDRFFIRGFDARNDVFVDGVRNPGVTSRELFATEQVEISKGPSSTFAGRGTTGGAVNSVSKKPQQTNFAEVGLMLGDDRRMTLDANKVVNDKLAIRTNIMLQDSDISGNSDRYDKRKGFAIAADYAVSDKASVLLDYYYLKGEDMPDFGHPWDSENDRPFDVDPSTFYGINKRDFHDTGASILTGVFNYDFSTNTKLTSSTRVGETTNDYVVGAPEGVSDGEVNSRAKSAGFTNKIVANNTQLTMERYLGDKEHTFAVGFDISKEEITNQPFDNTFGNLSLDIMNPDNNIGSGTVTRREGNSLVEANSSAIYFMDTIKFSPKWEAFGGVRYDRYDIENTGYDYNTATLGDTISFDKGFVNGHLGLTFKPRENGSIYGSVSTSSNLPGEMYDGVNSVDYGGLIAGMEDVKPEENVNIELGTKWELAGGDLLLGGAVYQIEKSNKIENAAGRREPADIRQSAEVQVRGLELSLSGNITPKLSLSGGLAVMDTKVTKSFNPDNVGKDLANVAEKSASLQLKYQASFKLALGGSLIHTGEIKGGNLAATTGNTLDASNRLDLMAEYKVNKKLSFQANVKNLTDENIYTALYRSGSPFTYVAPGRTFNVGLNYKF